MNFLEALKTGKHMRRMAWDMGPAMGWTVLLHGRWVENRRTAAPLLREDYLAEDWETQDE